MKNSHTSLYWLYSDEPYPLGHPFKDPIRNYNFYFFILNYHNKKTNCKKIPIHRQMDQQ